MASSNGPAAGGNLRPNPLEADARNGQVPLHSFNPEASPSEKAAAAGQSSDKLQSITPGAKSNADARAVAVDTGGSTVVPTITIEDVDKEDTEKNPNGPPEEKEEEVRMEPEPEPAQFPGDIATQPPATIPDWYRAGWREVSGIDDIQHEDRTVLDEFISEQFYGYWYHNAGVIVFAVFASYFLARFNAGWGWLFILLAVCSSYYGTSVKRLRTRGRDDVQRELVKIRLATETETADWLNHFLGRFWLLYEPVLSKSIIATVDQVLSTNTPAFLDSMRLSDFTLGNKAPRIESVRTYPNTDDDIVIMDWVVTFTPNDVSSMTPRQVAKKTNPKIVLSIRVGKGLATAALPVLVEDITFEGHMKFQLKLMSNFPHVQIVDFQFVERPKIDFALKPIGGETFGFDIANIPGLSSFIHEMTHATLQPMMYAPNFFTLNLEQMLSGQPLDTSIGVVAVTLQGARGIKVTKIGGSVPDPYVSINIENRKEVDRTKYKHHTSNPTWMETKFVLVNNLNEDLLFNVYDYNEYRKDSLVGTVTFKLRTLQDDATQENIAASLLREGKETGELKYDVSYYPVLTPEEKDGPLPDTNVGIVRLVIHQAKDLDNSKSMSGDLNPMAKVHLGDDRKASYKSPARKHTNDPVWEAFYEFVCMDKTTSKIVVRVIDDRDFLKDPEVGYMAIKLTDLLACTGKTGKDWYRLSNCQSGKIRISAEWKPLNMAGALLTPERYTPPIGVVRLHLDKATELKNVEAGLGGKSDPYVRVLVSNVVKSRTEVINNNLNPVWDQIIYIPVHSLKQTLLLECMDYQTLTKDRHLGSVEVNVSNLAKPTDNQQYPYESTGPTVKADRVLVEGDEYKGVMHYTAEFIPAMHLKDATFKTRPNELLQIAHNATDIETGSISSGSSLASSDDDYWPADLTIRVSEDKSGAVNAAGPTPEKTDISQSDDESKDEGVEMNTDELLTHQSGIILFNVLSGQLPRKARLEVLLDDGYWPCFSTTKARGTHAQWDYVGEGFMKELDFGYVWLRFNEASEGDKDEVIGVWKEEAKMFLKRALVAPQTFTLYDPNDSVKVVGSVVVEARFVPVPVELEPRETVSNQGILRVSLIDGQDLRAADRSGKSDPYVVFTLNGRKISKSEVKKKTLNPEWNEIFEFEITSRVKADLSLEVLDWNQLEQAKSLGAGQINVANIEPLQASDQVIALSLPNAGEKGHIRLNLLFTPRIIAKSRKNTTTFSAGRAMTQLGGLPVTAGKGVIHSVTGVFKRGDRDNEAVPIQAAAVAQAAPVENGSEPNQAAFPTKAAMDNNIPPATQEPGILRVVVGSATLTDESKAYVVLRVGDKEVKTKYSPKTIRPEWNETFNFHAGPLTPRLFAWVHEHRTLGKDRDLGETEVDLWNNLQLQGHSSKQLMLPLRSGGTLKLQLEFDSAVRPSSSGNSVSSGERVHRTISFTSPSRFSIRSRRPTAEED